MDFKSPLFLIALVCLTIPVIIHLFNLRKYKKLYFPSLRMLEEMAVKNKRLSKIQKWALFVSRFLSVLFLVLSFAHPYLSKKSIINHSGQKVLFIDNSMSSTYQTGQKTILDDLKDRAVSWIRSEGIEDIMILTNESLNNYTRLNSDGAIDYIRSIQPSPYSQNIQTLYNALQHIEEQTKSDVTAVILSDNQKSFYQSIPESFSTGETIKLLSLYTMAETELNNIYIDTCYFIQTPADSDISVQLVAEIRKTGTGEKNIDLSYDINGQAFANKTRNFQVTDSFITDTQSVNLKQNADNNIHIGFQSKELSFDDNYYISSKIANHIKVGIVNEGTINPQLTQAFNSSRKIFPEQFNSLSEIRNPEEYSLIFFNNISALSDADIELIKTYLDAGISLAFSFSRNASISSLKDAFYKIGHISVHGIDTVTQSVADIEINHPLIKDVISRKPDNIQLPLVNYRYRYAATLNARPQDLMKFRDGSGFITQFNLSKGALYLFSSPVDLISSNFSQSYYFAPVLYKMSTNSRHSDIQSYEIAEGKEMRINASFDENTILQLIKDDYRSIPVQKKDGKGTSMGFPLSLTSDGFYKVTDQQNNTLLEIGLNYDRTESQTTYLTSQELNDIYGIQAISFSGGDQNAFGQKSYFHDLWKWALGFVLLSLLIETYLLLKRS